MEFWALALTLSSAWMFHVLTGVTLLVPGTISTFTNVMKVREMSTFSEFIIYLLRGQRNVPFIFCQV